METSWSKDGESLPYHEELLVISNVTKGDEGSYSCLVTSPLDSASMAWAVQVVDPAFITHFTDYRLVLEGQAVELPCSASGQPSPSVAWSREEEVVEAGEEGSLSWTSVTAADSGDYRCQATNLAGTDTKVSLPPTWPYYPHLYLSDGLPGGGLPHLPAPGPPAGGGARRRPACHTGVQGHLSPPH